MAVVAYHPSALDLGLVIVTGQGTTQSAMRSWGILSLLLVGCAWGGAIGRGFLTSALVHPIAEQAGGQMGSSRYLGV